MARPSLAAVAVPEVARVPVPLMLDAGGVQTFFGVTASMAEYLMRQCPRRIEPEGKRKVYVRTSDLLDLLVKWEKAS